MVNPEKAAQEQPGQSAKTGQSAQAARNPQDKAAGGDLAANVAHGGQQPGQEGSGQPPVHPAAGEVQGRQEAASAGAPDGPYDEVAATDQAHAHAAPGTIEHEQAKAMAEAGPELLDPRERNQGAEARTQKENAEDLLKEHEQAAGDNAGHGSAGQAGTGQEQDRR